MSAEMRNYDLYDGCFSEYIDSTKKQSCFWFGITIAICLEINRLAAQLWPKAYAWAPRIDGLIRVMWLAVRRSRYDSAEDLALGRRDKWLEFLYGPLEPSNLPEK